MTVCPQCGMKSATPDVCEWCRRPMGAAPQAPTTPASTPQGVQYRVSLTGEVVEVTPPAPPTAYGAGPTQQMPAAVPAAARALPADRGYYEEISGSERWELFLAVALPIVAGTMALVHAMPGAFLPTIYLTLFVLGVLMCATRAIPSYDDAVTDCAVVLTLCGLFGPLPALVVYLIVGAIKQECNGALCAILGVNVVYPILLSYAVTHGGINTAPFASIGLFQVMNFFAVVVTFLGWFLGGFFRPVSEV